MEQRVTRAATELGYEPHFIAQSLRKGNTGTLGFLVADMSNPVFADIVRGAEDFARTKGYAVMLANSEGNEGLDAEHLRLFLRRRVDGIIVSTVGSGSEEVGRELANPNIRYVVIDRDVPPDLKVSGIMGDHATGMREATMHLINRGHRSIALISGPESLRPVRERARGFREAFATAGLKPRKDLIRLGSLRPEYGRDETANLLSLAQPPTAIVAGGNRLLAGVLEAIHTLGLEVGRQLALVSCDDVDLTRLYRPAISVVVRDTYKMGQLAADYLIDQLINPQAPIQNALVPTRFVARASSDFQWPRTSRAEVSRA
jgi:LacI family transcriptional regulator